MVLQVTRHKVYVLIVISTMIGSLSFWAPVNNGTYTFSAIDKSVLVYAQSQQNFTRLFEFVSKQGLPLEVSVKQGESAILPVEIKSNKNYEVESINLLLKAVPSKVNMWIEPNMIANEINAKHSRNGTIYIYADSNALPGNYTVGIIGKGLVKDLTTGEFIQVMNTTALKSSYGNSPEEFWQEMEQESVMLGLVHLTIIPNPNQISMDLGPPANKNSTFCVNDTGSICGGFTASSQFQVTLSSHKHLNVKLKAMDILDGVWLQVVPKELSIGPNNASAKIIISGAVKPFGMPTPDTRAITIQAISDNGYIATSFLPVIRTGYITVLHSPGPIEFKSAAFEGKILVNVNGTNFQTYGVVYDPDNNRAASLPVDLSVIGLVDGSKIIPIPQWLKIRTPNLPFELNPGEPHHFMIQATTSSAPVGTYSVAINETVGVQYFVSDLQIEVVTPMCTGPALACNPPTPAERANSTHLSFPFDVTVDDAGYIYVVDAGNDRIVKFDASGNFISKFGTSGAGDGQFSDPRGIATDKSGNIYVADTANDRIQKFDSSGKFILKFGSRGAGDGQFAGPYGIVLDNSGNIYVADVANARIDKFDSSGNFLLKFGSQGKGDGQFEELGSVAVDSSGYVYVTDIVNANVQKFDSSGKFVSKFGTFGTEDGKLAGPYGIAVDSSGNIYVADGNTERIQKFDSSGNFILKFNPHLAGDSEFNHIGGMAIDKAGNVYITDTDNDHIKQFDSHGKFVMAISNLNLGTKVVPEFPANLMVITAIGLIAISLTLRLKSRISSQ